MPTLKRNFCYRAGVLSALLLLTTGCGQSAEDVLPLDAVLIAQWQSESDRLTGLVEACAAEESAYPLAERYRVDNGFSTPSLTSFQGCELAADSAGDSDGFAHVATSSEDNISILVASQFRKGTGWVEETASRWTGGWVSWKSAILEEKGFLYVPQGEADLASAALPGLSIVTEPLDQFTGEYRVTSQISGNSSCEVWRLRPIEPDWYLFYHQSRECPN